MSRCRRRRRVRPRALFIGASGSARPLRGRCGWRCAGLRRSRGWPDGKRAADGLRMTRDEQPTPPAIPPMTRQPGAAADVPPPEGGAAEPEPYWLKRTARRAVEAAHIERLVSEMAEERDRQRLEEFEVAEAERWAQGLPAWGLAGKRCAAQAGAARPGAGDGAGSGPIRTKRTHGSGTRPCSAGLAGKRIWNGEMPRARGALFEEDESQREEEAWSCGGGRGASPRIETNPTDVSAGFTPRDGPRSETGCS